MTSTNDRIRFGLASGLDGRPQDVTATIVCTTRALLGAQI
jgi:hypothetical protein